MALVQEFQIGGTGWTMRCQLNERQITKLTGSAKPVANVTNIDTDAGFRRYGARHPVRLTGEARSRISRANQPPACFGRLVRRSFSSKNGGLAQHSANH
jgi:hypothetical protein